MKRAAKEVARFSQSISDQSGSSTTDRLALVLCFTRFFVKFLGRWDGYPCCLHFLLFSESALRC